jgi:hypothetical protein
MLQNLYKATHKKAKKEGYHDATLSRFSILVNPFSDDTRVCIFFEFYSKLTGRSYSFMIRDVDGIIDHNLPDRIAPSNTYVFQELPWKTSKDWISALKKAYLKAGKFSKSSKNAQYHISASPYGKDLWRVKFDDMQTGNTPTYDWSGKTGDEPILEPS